MLDKKSMISNKEESSTDGAFRQVYLSCCFNMLLLAYIHTKSNDTDGILSKK